MRIFLTGGSSGIGLTIKNTLEQVGIKVISPTSRELDLSTDFIIDPITVDGFIHCAGINLIADHKSINQTDMLKLFQINTFSFVNLCSNLNFTQGSNIIAIGSLYSTQTKESRMQYTMSKHALHGAVKTLALEKTSDKIKVNMISPGFVDTALTRKNNSKERIEFLNENIPLGLTDSCEIANLCLYLIKQNNAITGQNIIIDGGYSLKSI
jgi:NAD(P)-dependent dehydrogenase (short-subunit alcohol dehydrogenase family)